MQVGISRPSVRPHNWRRRSIARARASFIASLQREGRVMRQVRRCFIAGGGKPRSMSELVAWAFPELKRFKHWHRWSVRRALLRIQANSLI
jgi:hypothetical protein